jgi:hypothetical protein
MYVESHILSCCGTLYAETDPESNEGEQKAIGRYCGLGDLGICWCSRSLPCWDIVI